MKKMELKIITVIVNVYIFGNVLFVCHYCLYNQPICDKNNPVSEALQGSPLRPYRYPVAFHGFEARTDTITATFS